MKKSAKMGAMVGAQAGKGPSYERMRREAHALKYAPLMKIDPEFGLGKYAAEIDDKYEEIPVPSGINNRR